MSVNLNPTNYTQFLTGLPISWLNQDGYGAANASVLGYFFDLWNNEMLQALQARFPGYNALADGVTIFNASPNDALSFIGDERGLSDSVFLDDGYITDPLVNNDYRALLRLAWVYWKYAGTPLGILTQLYFQGYTDTDNSDITTMKVIQQNGDIYSLNMSAQTATFMNPIDLLEIIDLNPDFPSYGGQLSVGQLNAAVYYESHLYKTLGNYNLLITDPYDARLDGYDSNYIADGYDGYMGHPPWFSFEYPTDQNTGVYPDTNNGTTQQITTGGSPLYFNIYKYTNPIFLTVSGPFTGTLNVYTTQDGYFNDYINTSSASVANANWILAATGTNLATDTITLTIPVQNGQMIKITQTSLTSAVSINLTGTVSYNVRDSHRQFNSQFLLLFTSSPSIWADLNLITIPVSKLTGKGPYSSTTQYQAQKSTAAFGSYDYVEYNTYYYVCFNTPPIGTPPTNQYYWRQIYASCSPDSSYTEGSLAGSSIGVPNVVIGSGVQLQPSFSDIATIYNIVNKWKPAKTTFAKIYILVEGGEVEIRECLGYPVQTLSQRNTYNGGELNPAGPITVIQY